jgi:hypothetical protein
MNPRYILAAGALLCLLAVLAVPVTALAPAAGTVERATIDPGLKEELWTVHAEHRLHRFDGNVEAAGKTIEALEKHGYDASGLSTTLDAINGNRDVLAGALQDRNREELRSVNADLFSLWNDFRQGMSLLLTGD